jgi:hypothetical protein
VKAAHTHDGLQKFIDAVRGSNFIHKKALSC